MEFVILPPSVGFILKSKILSIILGILFGANNFVLSETVFITKIIRGLKKCFWIMFVFAVMDRDKFRQNKLQILDNFYQGI